MIYTQKHIPTNVYIYISKNEVNLIPVIRIQVCSFLSVFALTVEGIVFSIPYILVKIINSKKIIQKTKVLRCFYLHTHSMPVFQRTRVVFGLCYFLSPHTQYARFSEDASSFWVMLFLLFLISQIVRGL